MDDQAHVVTLDVQTPADYERAQLVVRLLIGCALGLVHQTLGGVFAALYLLLPLVAAILISRHTSKGYLEQDGPWLVSGLEWVVGLYAYMLFVTDRFPLGPAERSLRLVTQPHGEPKLSDALARLITSLPHAFVLLLLSILSALASLIMAFSVLVSKSVPETLRGFQLRLLGRAARLFVYHASLSKQYPHFSFRGGLLPPSTPAEGNA